MNLWCGVFRRGAGRPPSLRSDQQRFDSADLRPRRSASSFCCGRDTASWPWRFGICAPAVRSQCGPNLSLLSASIPGSRWSSPGRIAPPSAKLWNYSLLCLPDQRGHPGGLLHGQSGGGCFSVSCRGDAVRHRRPAHQLLAANRLLDDHDVHAAGQYVRGGRKLPEPARPPDSWHSGGLDRLAPHRSGAVFPGTHLHPLVDGRSVCPAFRNGNADPADFGGPGIGQHHQRRDRVRDGETQTPRRLGHCRSRRQSGV